MVKSQTLDRTFSALADPTRRDVLDRLALAPASITELARPYGISLPGMLKHVRILEEADLVTTRKQGRTREVTLAPQRMDDAERWMELHRERWERRLDRLEVIVERRAREQRTAEAAGTKPAPAADRQTFRKDRPRRGARG
jgi:DNA-binding transcriptional ArsR family regulator